MASFFYEVQVTLPDPGTAEAWLRWMRDGHLADVVAAGARCGRVVRVDDAPTTYVAQYEFDSREAFDRYVRDHAPRLRVDCLGKFPSPPVAYSRRTGEIVADSGEP